jgi:hypothetical protein
MRKKTNVDIKMPFDSFQNLFFYFTMVGCSHLTAPHVSNTGFYTRGWAQNIRAHLLTFPTWTKGTPL